MRRARTSYVVRNLIRTVLFKAVKVVAENSMIPIKILRRIVTVLTGDLLFTFALARIVGDK